MDSNFTKTRFVRLVLKLAAGTPLWFLLGYASYRLCELYSSEPKKSFAMWLSLPIVLMACSRTAMPDLMMCSFATISMWFFAEGQKEEASDQQVTRKTQREISSAVPCSWVWHHGVNIQLLLLFFSSFYDHQNPTKHALPILVGFWGFGAWERFFCI